MLLKPSSELTITHWQQEKCTRMNVARAAYDMILHNHMWQLPVSIFGVKIAALGFTGRLFKISKFISKERA
jgi:hypothetical protein